MRIIKYQFALIIAKVLHCRIITGSLSITATTNILRSLKRLTPPVSYAKAADVWIWACQFFVFAVLLELGVVNVVNRKVKKFQKEEHKVDLAD